MAEQLKVDELPIAMSAAAAPKTALPNGGSTSYAPSTWQPAAHTSALRTAKTRAIATCWDAHRCNYVSILFQTTLVYHKNLGCSYKNQVPRRFWDIRLLQRKQVSMGGASQNCSRRE